MKTVISMPTTGAGPSRSRLLAGGASTLVTRFGEVVDVRNRGTLRVGRYVGDHSETRDAPAVVRMWSDDQCRELSSHEARALAAQLLAAANLADTQNGH
jgi:hypothetical protein